MAYGRKTGGRTKGTPNKFDADIKGLILGALSDAGGREYLAARAKDQPVAFMGLLGKVLPLQVTGTGPNGALVVDFRWADAPDAAPVIDAIVDTDAATAIEWADEPPKGHAD